MKQVEIKYNPYLVKTEIRINGKVPNYNSSLVIMDGMRIQEWIEEYPNTLKEETGDSNFEVIFTGIKEDFEDVKSAFNACNDIDIKTIKLKETKKIADVEKEIDNIFSDIKNGPISELKSEEIKDAFEKVKNDIFDVNVVSTMSSGKSTLINSLLQKKLMPAANLATTSIIVEVIDKNQPNYHLSAYNAEGNNIKDIEDVSYEELKDLNENGIQFSRIVIEGKIPFVETIGMKLSLIDTPGPNNSKNKEHREKTYSMLKNSDKSLVLYVINATQTGVSDEDEFLSYVCTIMKEGGKQSRERFLFVVNKMDEFKPKEEGKDCIDKALKQIKQSLVDKGIDNPNIFPVSSLSALELRTNDNEPDAIINFKSKIIKYDCLHLEKYCNYSNIPKSIRDDIENRKKNADENKLIEIHTGIVSIESAIKQYINKYSRPIKINNLVLSFKNKLNELNLIEDYKKVISEDENKKQEFEKQIAQLNEKIKIANNKNSFEEKFDKAFETNKIEKEIEGYVKETNIKIQNLKEQYNNLHEVQNEKDARKKVEYFINKCNDFGIELKNNLEGLIKEEFEKTFNSLLKEYEKYLVELQISNTELNPLNLISCGLKKIKVTFDKEISSTFITTYKDKKIKVGGNRFFTGGIGGIIGGVAGFFIGGPIGAAIGATLGAGGGAVAGHGDGTISINEPVKEVFFDVTKHINDNLKKVDEQINIIKDGAKKYIEQQKNSFIVKLEESFYEIENMLSNFSDELKSIKSEEELTKQKIEENEKKSKFLLDIKKRVDEIIEF